MTKNGKEAELDVLAALNPTERVAYRVGRALNETEAGKRFSSLWGTYLSVPILGLTIRNRLHLEGVEHIPRRSMILAANHRTWFDLYATLIATWEHYPQTPYLYCPVRSGFFYEKPLGVVLNVGVSGNSMYPPVFRDERGPVLNRHAVDVCVRLLEWSPRVVVAMHPEGKRNPSDDPYALLPARTGIGRIALRSRADVLPTFVNGLPRSFKRLVQDRLEPTSEPVRVLVGAPVELADLYDRAEDPAAWREASERIMDAIAARGARDREIMAAWRETRGLASK